MLRSELSNAWAFPWKRVAIEAACEDCRGLFYRRHRRSDGAVRREIETQRYRRKLALVINRQRSGRGADGGELAERDHAAATGLCIDSAESVRPKLVARIDSEDDVVFVQDRMNPRHMALTEAS